MTLRPKRHPRVQTITNCEWVPRWWHDEYELDGFHRAKIWIHSTRNPGHSWTPGHPVDVASIERGIRV